MLKIKRLELEGFRSFKEKAIIDFPDQGLVLISGKYAGSDISSGSGKSSILLAIAFALDICDLPGTDLKNWDSSKMSVKLTIEDGNRNVYDIVRSPKLTLFINGEEYQSLSTGAKEKIAEILNTSPELLKALTYRPQRSTGKFINMTDSGMKDFLSSVLKLDALELAADRVEADIKNFELGLERQKGFRDASHRALEAGSILTTEDLQKAQKEYERAALTLKNLETNSAFDEINAEIKLIQTKLHEANQVSQKVSQAEYENKAIRSQVMTLHEEIAQIKSNICYTCKREWDSGKGLQEAKEQRLQELLQKMQVNISIIKNSSPILENAPTLQSKMAELQMKIGQAKAPVESARSAKQSAAASLYTITSVFETRKKEAENLEAAVRHIASIEEDLRLLRYQQEILGRNGFLGSIFDEVLKEIESRTNDMLSAIPNVSEFTVSISSTSVSKAGTSKKTISKKLYKNGKEVGVKALSGGQQCSLELCTDLAVAETIRARHGSELGWISLDEAMDGLGIAEKQAALDIIRSKVKGLVLIIDHSTEIKEGFEKIIEIEYNGKESYVARA